MVFFRNPYFYYVLAVIVLTASLQLYDFGLPALWPDETAFFVLGLTLVATTHSSIYNFSMQFGDHIGIFPLQHAEAYIGALESYFVTPVTYFFGLNIFSIRGYEAFTTIMIIILTYLVGKELFSKRVAVISISLLSILPMFVFYSRQSITYEWSLICIGLTIVLFALKYLKTLKNRYLFGSLFLIGMGIWAYLWFLWFVLGLVIIIPLIVKGVNTRLKQESLKYPSGQKTNSSIMIRYGRLKFSLSCLSALLLGFVPLILQYFHNPKASLVPFLLDTIKGNNQGYLSSSNSNFLQNLLLRTEHIFSILGTPSTGLWFSWIVDGPNEISYVYPILFLFAIVISLFYVLMERKESKQIIGVMLLLLVILISSSFTVSDFNPLQLGITLPFIFILISKGIDIGVANKITSRFSFFSNLKCQNCIIGAIVIGMAVSQVPFIIENYGLLEKTPTATTYPTYQKLNNYLKENNLVPVTSDWGIIRSLVVYSNEQQIPKIISVGYPSMVFNNDTKESLVKLETMNLLDPKYLFLVLIYPKEPPCTTVVSEPYSEGHACAEMYFVESAATRNNKKLEKIDFTLSDGTPYIRAFRFAN